MRFIRLTKHVLHTPVRQTRRMRVISRSRAELGASNAVVEHREFTLGREAITVLLKQLGAERAANGLMLFADLRADKTQPAALDESTISSEHGVMPHSVVSGGYSSRPQIIWTTLPAPADDSRPDEDAPSGPILPGENNSNSGAA